MKKRCGKCRKLKPVSGFGINRSRPDGRNNACKPCHREYLKAHYKKNRAYYIAKARKWNDGLRKEIGEFLNWLKAQPCWDCHETFPVVCMDFDHVRGKKKFNLAWWFFYAWTWEEVIKEVLKCEVVCANCHRLRTQRRSHETMVEAPLDGPVPDARVALAS